MLSTDGKTWTQVGSWSKPAHNQDDLNVAANFKGAFYVGGGYFSGRLTATRDGKTWNDGVISVINPPAAARGIKIGMTAKEAARLMLL